MIVERCHERKSRVCKCHLILVCLESLEKSRATGSGLCIDRTSSCHLLRGRPKPLINDCSCPTPAHPPWLCFYNLLVTEAFYENIHTAPATTPFAHEAFRQRLTRALHNSQLWLNVHLMGNVNVRLFTCRLRGALGRHFLGLDVLVPFQDKDRGTRELLARHTQAGWVSVGKTHRAFYKHQMLDDGKTQHTFQ